MNKVIKSPRVSEQEYIIPVSGKEKTPEQMPENRMIYIDDEKRLEAEQESRRREIEHSALEKGRQAGRAEEAKAYEEKIAAMQSLLQAVEGEIEAFYKRMEIRLSDVAVAMVKKIVGTTSELNSELIHQSIRKVLSQHNEPGELLTLHLHPEDYQRMAPQESVAPTNLKMMPDPGIQRGGCLLQTNYGLIDARLETQLQELERVLREQAEAQSPLSQVNESIKQAVAIRAEGRVLNIMGTVIESRGPGVTVGEQCEILGTRHNRAIRAEVIGFKNNQVLLMPLEDAQGIGPGNRVISKGHRFTVQAGDQLLGRVLNALGQPIDGLGAITGGETVSINAKPNNPMQRRAIHAPLYTGVRAIDGVLTCARGGRMGIFAGSGVGKSVLLGMMARNTEAEVNEIGRAHV